MHRLIVAVTAVGMGVLVASVPAAARGAGEAGELEHARANARAGGPVSERDAELLDRWGCLSGTESAYCKKLSHRTHHREHKRRER